MTYRKLRASRNGFGSSSRLYLGEDHVLSVEASLFTEKYYRFFFSDIQAIVVRKTDRGGIWSIFLAFTALLMTTCSIGAIPAGQWTPTPGYFTMAILAVALMVVNLFKGPTCDTRIQTSVTVQSIGALHRLKRTEEILPQIRSRIRSTQGALTREQIAEKTLTPEDDFIFEEDLPPGFAVPEPEPMVKDPSSYHRFAFAMSLLNAGLNAMWLFISGMTVYVAGALGGMAGFFGIIAALIVQTRKNSTPTVRKITWLMFASYIALFFVGYSLSIYYMFQAGLESLADPNSAGPFSFYSELVEKGPAGKPGLYLMTVVSVAVNALLGTWGLAAVGTGKHEGMGTAEEVKII